LQSACRTHNVKRSTGALHWRPGVLARFILANSCSGGGLWDASARHHLVRGGAQGDVSTSSSVIATTMNSAVPMLLCDQTPDLSTLPVVHKPRRFRYVNIKLEHSSLPGTTLGTNHHQIFFMSTWPITVLSRCSGKNVRVWCWHFIADSASRVWPKLLSLKDLGGAVVSMHVIAVSPSLMFHLWRRRTSALCRWCQLHRCFKHTSLSPVRGTCGSRLEPLLLRGGVHSSSVD
jgi:hypothetical protein